MNTIKLIAVLALSMQLSGCFFVFIPGSVIAKVGDVLTGSEGDHCVGTETRVGDQMPMPKGFANATVLSLSGASTRCTNPLRPIRAKLTPLQPEEK